MALNKTMATVNTDLLHGKHSWGIIHGSNTDLDGQQLQIKGMTTEGDYLLRLHNKRIARVPASQVWVISTMDTQGTKNHLRDPILRALLEQGAAVGHDEVLGIQDFPIPRLEDLADLSARMTKTPTKAIPKLDRPPSAFGLARRVAKDAQTKFFEMGAALTAKRRMESTHIFVHWEGPVHIPVLKLAYRKLIQELNRIIQSLHVGQSFMLTGATSADHIVLLDALSLFPEISVINDVSSPKIPRSGHLEHILKTGNSSRYIVIQKNREGTEADFESRHPLRHMKAMRSDEISKAREAEREQKVLQYYCRRLNIPFTALETEASAGTTVGKAPKLFVWQDLDTRKKKKAAIASELDQHIRRLRTGNFLMILLESDKGAKHVQSLLARYDKFTLRRRFDESLLALDPDLPSHRTTRCANRHVLVLERVEFR